MDRYVPAKLYIQGLNQQLFSNAKICKVNIDEEPELAQRFQVMSIPTLVVMNQGKVVNSIMGVRPKKEILNMLAV